MKKEPLKLIPLDEMGKLLARIATVQKGANQPNAEPERPSKDRPASD